MQPTPAHAARRRHGDLARTQLAWAMTTLATWAYTAALAVYAFGHGGAAAVGLAVGLRTLPSALAGPFVGALADRRERATVMAGAAAVAALAVAASAAGATGLLPPGAVYALGLLVTVAGMAFRTAMTAALPGWAGRDGALVSANVATSAIENGGVFAGPVLAAGLFLLGGPAAALGGAAVAFAAAGLLVLGTRAPRPAAVAGDAPRGPVRMDADAVTGTLVLLFAQTVASGALGVSFVLCSSELLHRGTSATGLLMAAFGAGGLLGSAVSARLERRGGLLRWGLAAWSVPLALLGLAPGLGVALALLLVAGAGNALFDVATVTLLQRAVPDARRARTFGTVETVVVMGLGLGGACAPVLVHLVGLRPALAVVGALLPLAAVATPVLLRARRATADRLLDVASQRGTSRAAARW